eukprot:gene10632-biopygen748
MADAERRVAAECGALETTARGGAERLEAAAAE